MDFDKEKNQESIESPEILIWHDLRAGDGSTHQLSLFETTLSYRTSSSEEIAEVSITEDQSLILGFALERRGELFRAHETYQVLAEGGSPKERFNAAISDRRDGLMVLLESLTGQALWQRYGKDHHLGQTEAEHQEAVPERPAETNPLDEIEISVSEKMIIAAIFDVLKGGERDENEIAFLVTEWAKHREVEIDLGSRPMRKIRGVVHKLSNAGENLVDISDYGKGTKAKRMWMLAEEYLPRIEEEPEKEQDKDERTLLVEAEVIRNQRTTNVHMIQLALPPHLRRGNRRTIERNIRAIVRNGVEEKRIPYKVLKVLRGRSLDEAYRPLDNNESLPWQISNQGNIIINDSMFELGTEERLLIENVRREVDSLDNDPERTVVASYPIVKLFSQGDLSGDTIPKTIDKILKMAKDIETLVGQSVIVIEEMSIFNRGRTKKLHVISLGDGYQRRVEIPKIDDARSY